MTTISLQMAQFFRWVALPSLLFFLGFYAFYLQHLDFVVAHFYFNLEGGHWSLSRHWLVQDMLHNGTRLVNQLLVLLLVGYWLVLKMKKTQGARVRALGRLLLSLITSFIVIALLKKVLLTDCPWDLYEFGGTRGFISLFELRPVGADASQCFPAGHASVGFAWLALYFYWLPLSVNKARTALWLALGLGFTLGLAQQLRGAHFLSHDLTTAWICWCIAALFYVVVPEKGVSQMQYQASGESHA